ncbi:hypothetical protein J2Q11_03090 [Tenacibaculum finnmarkense genomovar finnmarkense]|uniref:DUF6140 family protein n=1 Tax=Tenacibaculum finnmarkense TaxID=2781243 RepID=UPI00187BA88B|nr:DUF6140 family protein [Tenacibaculum finnmarkense]MBE7659189.1 hypothetical protein [Tenacibaculum finnmarkense genomovar finnmarkense]MCD8416402.1 DUF6140 family protein [Tenacibaculum finnmarkense genomovar finnmarkense]MCD8453054.1 DUF6140 family protein [Tenacibaculum finnmarkense genomovar ulcerans]MCG8185062.1 hypothetical protein [Tenacibaculum finnmarkense genomovar finnmarkense]MCG8201104.1 hypothetical protein [Tenacibaculum finnmarkense genomovar finnmarkense]
MATFQITLKRKLYIDQQWVEPGISVTVVTPGTMVWTTDGKQQIINAFSRMYGLIISPGDVSMNTFSVN